MGTLELTSQSLKLDPALRSLDRPDPEIDRIWLEEAERRLRAYREGKVDGIPAEEVFGEF